MKSKELLKKIKKIEIKSRLLVKEVFQGEYHSVFKGNGMEFEDIREYYPGDDIRNIDWKVTARQKKAYVKKFKEERELNLYLIVDMSASNDYGGKKSEEDETKNKKDYIAEVSSTLAFSALKNNDKVGALLFSDKVEKFVPSKKGTKHTLSIIENILEFDSNSKKTDIKTALRKFIEIEKKKSIVFLISDFLDDGYEKELKILSKKHDLILVKIRDRSEEKNPTGAIFAFSDLETGESIYVDNRKEDLKINAEMTFKNLLTLYTDRDFVKPLMSFFKRRMRR